jgi:3-isopropylmalate/(R)-2-methylmalate dehydratase small subunit
VEKFTVHTGIAAPLRRSDVDTDQIIPAEYLKRVTRTGFEDGLFNSWRADESFVLNDPTYARASILVAGPRFGVGSSREHAVWALQDYGFRAVIAPSFGDIFRNNALKGGLLPVLLPEKAIEELWLLMGEQPGVELTVDLVARQVRGPAASSADPAAPPTAWEFPLDEHSRWRLIEGLDDIGLTLRHEDAIAAFEATRPTFKPVVA